MNSVMNSVMDMNSVTEPLRIDRTFPPSLTISTRPLEYVSLSAPIDEVNTTFGVGVKVTDILR